MQREQLERILRELTELVGAMRHAQKTYFRLRSSTSLAEAKRLEVAVDEYLEKLASPALFDDGG